MVERSPKRAQRTPIAVSGKSPTKSVEICAVLERDRANDGAIARIRIGRRIGLVVVQEDFAKQKHRDAMICATGSVFDTFLPHLGYSRQIHPVAASIFGMRMRL